MHGVGVSMLAPMTPSFRLLAVCALATLPLAAQPAKADAQKTKKVAMRKLGKVVVDTAPIRRPAERGQALGRVDVLKTAQRLVFANADVYHFKIWNGPDDWTDAKLLARKLEASKIQLWLSPKLPTHGGNSRPHMGDYTRWVDECIKLGKRHKNVTAIVWYEHDVGRNSRILHPARCADMKALLNKHGIHLLASAFDANADYAKQYKDSFNGIIAYNTNTSDFMGISLFADGVRAVMPKSWKVYLGTWAAATPWNKAVPETTQLFVVMRTGLKRLDGTLVRELDLKKPSRIRMGADGNSKLLRVVRDLSGAERKGKDIGRPDY